MLECKFAFRHGIFFCFLFATFSLSGISGGHIRRIVAKTCGDGSVASGAWLVNHLLPELVLSQSFSLREFLLATDKRAVVEREHARVVEVNDLELRLRYFVHWIRHRGREQSRHGT